MPPRPATAQTDNYSRLTVDIKNKYDSLNLILRVSDGIEYAINQNTLLLYNPETKIRARFFIP
jgi:Ni,Fe-hydrogenase III large subunit